MQLLTQRTALPDPIEVASRDEIAALQLARLKSTLRRAYDNIPPLPPCVRALEVHPDDLHSLDDLRKFPTTSKDDLRANYPFGMFAVPREQVVRIHASSGTTGKPTVVGYTKGDIETWAEVMARSIRAAGGRPGDIVHVAFGYGLFTGGLGAHYGAERLGCTVVPMSGGQTARQVQLINDFRPDIIMVTPSYMLAIGDEFEREGLDPRRMLAAHRHCTAPSPGRRRCASEIEARFGMNALDLYGLSEIIGPGVACECVESKDGLHLWEDHFYPEIIDPATGEAVPDGEPGELVLTSLTKEAMPVIRYRTRDLTRLLPGTARSMRRMAENYRAHRRHADHSRRQRVPEPDRGTDPERAAAVAALRAGSVPARAPGRAGRGCRGAAGAGLCMTNMQGRHARRDWLMRSRPMSA